MQTNVDGSVPEGATLNQLLAMSTYQGMSDAQIQQIIDFKCEDARRKGELDAEQRGLMNQMDSIIKEQQALAESTGAVLDKALASQPMFIQTPGGKPEVVQDA